tara:strand:+ start:23051 stop:24046 length:996 start_codon:yes stop_codon:yes gene_type:complete
VKINKHNFIITTSPGNSGGGAILDFLRTQKNFVSPFLNQEFRLFNDPGGLNELYFFLYEYFSPNNCSEAFYKFLQYIESANKMYFTNNNIQKKIYTNQLTKLSKIFVKKIIKVSYKALPFYKFHSLDNYEKFQIKLLKKINFQRRIQSKNFNMILPVDKKEYNQNLFIFIDGIIKNALKQNKLKIRKNILLDQANSFFLPNQFKKYNLNSKMIRVTRDPRSVFYSMKFRKAGAFPGYDVYKFISWYKEIMNVYDKRSKKNDKDYLNLKFEDFVNNYQKTSSKIGKYLNIKNLDLNRFDIKKTKVNAYKAKSLLSESEQNLIKFNLKSYLQW